MNAKDVKPTMSSTNGPTDTDSAPNVEQRFRLDVSAFDLSMVKCTNCKAATPTSWVEVTPNLAVGHEGEFDPLELLALRKRLTMCTNCGNLRLTK